MDIALLLRGIVIGLSIAAPVGPIGLLCIQRTLALGRAHGLASGLGAATADAAYGCVAALGLTLVSGLLIRAQGALQVAGGIYLCYLGLRTFGQATAPAGGAAAVKEYRLLGAYLSTLLLTLTNPVTVLSFLAIVASLGAVASAGGGGLPALHIVLGVFCGSALWWLFLSSVTSRFHTRMTPLAMCWINRAAGAIICAFGAAALLSFLSRWLITVMAQ